MKIQLVVASGVHQGKAIPVPNGKITIGRDPSCQLRPASPAVSKLHCTIQVRDGKVYITDHGSTNGTLLGDEPISGEVEAPLGSRIRVGPLDFTLQPVAGSKPDNTPLPEALKSVSAPAGGRLSDATGSKAGVAPAKPAGTPMPTAATKPPAPAVIDAEKPTEVRPSPRKSAEVSDADAMAALLLSEDDDSNPISVPDGSTVFEMPSVDAEKARIEAEKKKPTSAAETSNAANEILKKYMRRPR